MPQHPSRKPVQQSQGLGGDNPFFVPNAALESANNQQNIVVEGQNQAIAQKQAQDMAIAQAQAAEQGRINRAKDEALATQGLGPLSQPGQGQQVSPQAAAQAGATQGKLDRASDNNRVEAGIAPQGLGQV